MYLAIDIWLYFMDRYRVLATSPTTLDGKMAFTNNAKAIFCGLSDPNFVKVMQRKYAKEIVDKL